jgi:hypothetical protein
MPATLNGSLNTETGVPRKVVVHEVRSSVVTTAANTLPTRCRRFIDAAFPVHPAAGTART